MQVTQGWADFHDGPLAHGHGCSAIVSVLKSRDYFSGEFFLPDKRTFKMDRWPTVTAAVQLHVHYVCFCEGVMEWMQVVGSERAQGLHLVPPLRLRGGSVWTHGCVVQE